MGHPVGLFRRELREQRYMKTQDDMRTGIVIYLLIGDKYLKY